MTRISIAPYICIKQTNKSPAGSNAPKIMKYQVFNRENNELGKIQDFCTMLSDALGRCDAEKHELEQKELKQYKSAQRLEEAYGANDEVTTASWTLWTMHRDDLRAVESRIEELQDALRFSKRLLNGSF